MFLNTHLAPVPPSTMRGTAYDVRPALPAHAQICPRKHRWLSLLGLSITFYCIASVKYLPYILFTTLVIFFAARAIGKTWEKLEADLKAEGLEKEGKKALKAKAKKKAKRILIFALVLTVGVLCYTKFTKFLVGPINKALKSAGSGHKFSAANILVPLGISYYTFSTVTALSRQTTMPKFLIRRGRIP